MKQESGGGMNVAIYDNNRKDIEVTASIVMKCLNELEIIYYIKAADNGDDIEKILDTNEVDVLLTDINTEGISGFEIADKYIHKTGYIIFVTNESELVYEAVKHKPYRFIRKDHIEELYEAFASIKDERKHKVTNILRVRNSENETTLIKCSDIIYIESYNGKLHIHTENGVYEERMAMKDMIAQLNRNFVRVHRGYIVNMEKIKSISRKYVALDAGGKLAYVPVKRNFAHELASKYVDMIKV